MTTNLFLASLISKLIDVRVHVRGVDRSKHPKRVLRFQLEGFLSISKAELLEGLGIVSADGRPYDQLKEKEKRELFALIPTKTLAQAVSILTRIETGKDSFGTIADKAELLIKAVHPRYAVALEAIKLEAAKRAVRMALETRFAALSGGKALPAGIETPQLSDMVGEMRDELLTEAQRLMDEVNEPSLRHPDVGRISDKNLLAFASLLKSRRAVLKPVRTSLGSKLRELIAT